MYRIAVCRKGQPAQQRTANAGELRTAVYELIESQGSRVTEKDHSGIGALIDDARAMAEADGFAALEFEGAAITIRPDRAPAPTFPGGGF
jgi:hypothetical protein